MEKNRLEEVSINYNPKKPYYDYTIDDWVVNVPPYTTFEYREKIEDRDFFVTLEVSRIVRQSSGLICLESEYLFIADIDSHDIEKTRNKIIKFQEQEPSLFYLYKTKNGLRVIRADKPYSGVAGKAHRLLCYLDSDSKYIQCCLEIGKFVARITPKMSISSIEKYFHRAYVDKEFYRTSRVKVCQEIETLNCNKFRFDEPDSMLYDSILAHDSITSPSSSSCYRLM